MPNTAPSAIFTATPSLADGEPDDGTARKIALLPTKAITALFVAVATVIVIALVSYVSLQNVTSSGVRVARIVETLQHIETILSDLKDTESGQRGFLLTADEDYLDPFTSGKAALDGEFKALHSLFADDPHQTQQLDTLAELASAKLGELEQTIALRRAGKEDVAMAVVKTNRGKNAMDQARSLVRNMEDYERTALTRGQIESRNAAANALFAAWSGSALLLVMIAIAAGMLSRDYRARETNTWLRTGQMRLNQRLQGDQRVDELSDKIVRFLARYLDAHVGAVHLLEDDHFERSASYALAGDEPRPTSSAGAGLIRQAAKENQVLHIRNVPKDYLRVTSSVGAGTARELIIAPASVDARVHAIVELGFFRKVGPADLEFMTRACLALGIALRSAKDRTQLESLLEETQRQAEELQVQQEELKVNNEELEEQSRVLKQSQTQLELQQVELEQTNAQLEEQTQLLEAQKDDLNHAQAVLTGKAAELERVNKYKSEFLANMSHELRTPLNSTLILAKLLADNKQGNLSEEQVKFAQTISSAGNDLLALINDILDLSKIEAGKVDVRPEAVMPAQLVDGLMRTFQPLAAEKELELTAVIEPDTPATFESDSQRVLQILRNLLSNAVKFTERGSIELRIRADVERGIAFVVRDSGIGVAGHQLDLIFEAFRQADGSTHRKYGGTGLGLSISRDLARLLGGELRVESQVGVGSTFILSLPLAHRPKAISLDQPQSIAAAAGAPIQSDLASAAQATSIGSNVIGDDRDKLGSNGRVILVVEDDIHFAGVLCDLAHEMGFLCIATHTANDGLAAAMLHKPSAILLDMNLPDHSGLGVLDQLKRNPQTRHIPVHVISVADYSQEALELGAVGYALKPVKREELVQAFTRLEEKFSQTLRRILVVEDDPRQAESIARLLGSADNQISLVSRADQALEHLRSTTFDCMIMDLNLPDMSGRDLLEKMAQLDHIAFPPVIVYTGRTLTRDEEHVLHRYSKSIIIKDARSPERLLDEVTLFLHQVESRLPLESQRMLKDARNRDATLVDRRILIVEDDVRNIFALSSILEGKGTKLEIARNGIEAIAALRRSSEGTAPPIDLVLMDIMMPEMDGITAMREIRMNNDWKRIPIIALTAKAMKDDQERCLAAGANDYIAKPLDVEKLLSLVRVWMPKG